MFFFAVTLCMCEVIMQLKSILYNTAIKALGRGGYILLRYDDSSKNSRKFYGIRTCMTKQVNWGRLDIPVPSVSWDTGRVKANWETDEAFYAKVRKGYRVVAVQFRKGSGEPLDGYQPLPNGFAISEKNGKFGIYDPYGSLVTFLPEDEALRCIENGMKVMEATSLGVS